MSSVYWQSDSKSNYEMCRSCCAGTVPQFSTGFESVLNTISKKFNGLQKVCRGVALTDAVGK
jgi:hypothetical protein